MGHLVQPVVFVILTIPLVALSTGRFAQLALPLVFVGLIAAALAQSLPVQWSSDSAAPLVASNLGDVGKSAAFRGIGAVNIDLTNNPEWDGVWAADSPAHFHGLSSDVGDRPNAGSTTACRLDAARRVRQRELPAARRSPLDAASTSAESK